MAYKVGTFVWYEVHTGDVDKSKEYYAGVLGWKSEEMDEPYHMLKVGESMMGGAMTSPMEGGPAMWLPYIAVKDLEATIERAKARGGEALSPIQDVPNVGRFSVVKEPAGAVVGLITPAVS